MSAARSRFRYALDPLCLAACALYALNRWGLKPALQASPFIQGHFNDTLLIPAALPLVLWLQRRLRLRKSDVIPSMGEITLHLAVWAFIAECAGPFLLHRGTTDWRDVVAYSAGAAVACVLWRRGEIPCRLAGTLLNARASGP